MICIFEDDGAIVKFEMSYPPDILVRTSDPQPPSFVSKDDFGFPDQLFEQAKKIFVKTNHMMVLGKTVYVAYKKEKK